jgi:predicted metal-binding protein
MAQGPAGQETCHQQELTGRGVPGGDLDVGLVDQLPEPLPSPVEKVTEKLDASQAIHRIIVCTLCRDPATGIRTGADLCAELRSLLSAHGEMPLLDYVVEGIACMAGCTRPLTVAFQADGKASYLFGSIDRRADAAELVEFAKLYASLGDGWCNSGQRPSGLADKTLARIPGPRIPMGGRA